MIKKIKEIFNESISKKDIAGGNLLALKENKELIYYDGGFSNIEKKLPIKRNSIFRLYSMTKPITATAIMILLERGKIDLFDPVCKYLSGFKNQYVSIDEKLVPVERDVTIKDLLSMTSGLIYGGKSKTGKAIESIFQEIDKKLFSSDPMNTVDIVNSIGKCPLSFQPGTSWDYGVSADVLGAIIEIVSNKTFGAFLNDELFTPLNMIDTSFWLKKDQLNRLVKTYSKRTDGNLVQYTGNHLGINNKMDFNPAFESGGAGLNSTIDDYKKFALMLLNGGSFNNTKILNPRTVEYLTTCTLNSNQQKHFNKWFTLEGHSYGNLMRVMINNTESGFIGSNGEYGWDGWLGTYFCNIPKENLTILVMIQKTYSGTTDFVRKLRNVIITSI
jgi:CubicO group peptidase (beta-lactamase class C family)